MKQNAYERNKFCWAKFGQSQNEISCTATSKNEGILALHGVLDFRITWYLFAGSCQDRRIQHGNTALFCFRTGWTLRSTWLASAR